MVRCLIGQSVCVVDCSWRWHPCRCLCRATGRWRALVTVLHGKLMTEGRAARQTSRSSSCARKRWPQTPRRILLGELLVGLTTSGGTGALLWSIWRGRPWPITDNRVTVLPWQCRHQLGIIGPNRCRVLDYARRRGPDRQAVGPWCALFFGFCGLAAKLDPGVSPERKRGELVEEAAPAAA